MDPLFAVFVEVDAEELLALRAAYAPDKGASL